MLQNAIIPLGVDGGTRSRAADSMITYRTEREGRVNQEFTVSSYTDHY